MIQLKPITIIIVALLSLMSCKKSFENKQTGETSNEYAIGFKIITHSRYTEIELTEPYPEASTSIKYLLVPKGEKIPVHNSDTQVIRTPVDKIVCTSTSHIALLDHLGEVDKLVGFPTTDLISSKNARARIDSGLVADLGIDQEMNLELLFSLNPELVMGYSISGDMIKLNKIKELGIPVVINAEYLENHPLGRAEWIKYMGAFFGEEKKADSIFKKIKNEYLKYQLLASRVSSKPTAMSGILYGDAWFLPGGKNYAARLFSDAGYQYLWEDDPTSGFLKFSFESVYAKGQNADYWIGVGSFGSRVEMQNAESRYALFSSFRAGQVYTYDARKGSTGGSEYFELGYSRPDIVLKDLIKIAHPELLPDYPLYFYQRLN